jgi:hypothetical protein
MYSAANVQCALIVFNALKQLVEIAFAKSTTTSRLRFFLWAACSKKCRIWMYA